MLIDTKAINAKPKYSEEHTITVLRVYGNSWQQTSSSFSPVTVLIKVYNNPNIDIKGKNHRTFTTSNFNISKIQQSIVI